MSTGPFTLLPHKSVTATLAIGVAHPSTTSSTENLDSLLRLMAGAHRFFASAIDDGGIAGHTMHHFGDVPHVVSVKSPKELEGVKLDCSPNPAKSSVIIRYTFADNNAPHLTSLALFDITGREVLSVYRDKLLVTRKHRASMDVAGLPNGSYYLRLSFGEKSIVRSLLINH
jgi:hypothetical protein